MSIVATATTNQGIRDGRPAPRWAIRTAHLIPLLTVPSGLWRLALVLGVPLGLRIQGHPMRIQGPGQTVYVLSLTVVSEAVALLALGLVRPWGERFPGWFPLLGGRRVPPPYAIAAATTGAVALMAIWAFATVNMFGNPGPRFERSGWGFPLLLTCYAPLLLWGPLLLVVTWAYYRRRCHD